MRRLAALLIGFGLAGHAEGAERIIRADFIEPTTRYDHGVLGDRIEFGALRVVVQGRGAVIFRLPETRVFEDLQPRLADLDGDGLPEVIVVETEIAKGAQLAIYGPEGKIAATPPLGQTHRWLAPFGAADLDGDGRAEIALVARPHLDADLQVWRYADGRLALAAHLAGTVTNHRIGDTVISGGFRHCDGRRAEIVAPSADWATVMAVGLVAGRLVAERLGPLRTDANLRQALGCAR